MLVRFYRSFHEKFKEIRMKILLIIFVALIVIKNVLANPSNPLKLRDESRKIKHERIAPSGGTIGFIKEKYYENPKKVRENLF